MLGIAQHRPPIRHRQTKGQHNHNRGQHDHDGLRLVDLDHRGPNHGDHRFHLDFDHGVHHNHCHYGIYDVDDRRHDIQHGHHVLIDDHHERVTAPDGTDIDPAATARILFLCTGNASRSVLAGAALSTRRQDFVVATAGTLVIDGLPMSQRTRVAFDQVGLSSPHHRSRQATASMLTTTDLVVAMAPEHVHWVRRNHEIVAERTATLIHLVRRLDPPATGSLSDRLARLHLDRHDPDQSEEIVDPGGGEVDGYVAVAHQIVELVDRLAPRL